MVNSINIPINNEDSHVLEVKIGDGAYVKVNIPLSYIVNNDGIGDGANYVSYTRNQNKTDVERSQARNNIGISDDMYERIVHSTYQFEDGLVVDNNVVSVLIDPESEKDTEGNDLLSVSSNGLKFSGTTLSNEQRTAIDWAIGKRVEELQDEADTLFVLNTSANGSTFWADRQITTTMVVSVNVKFDDYDIVPKNDENIQDNGWTCVDVGLYTKSISGSGGTINAQEFTYQVEDGAYEGITCTKSSDAKTISAYYPIYYGWATSKNINSVLWNNDKFVRSETTLGSPSALADITIENNTGGNAYFFVLTRSNVSVQIKQSGNSVIDNALTNQSFVSPENSLITMSGYRLYFTSENFASGKTPKFSVYIPR